MNGAMRLVCDTPLTESSRFAADTAIMAYRFKANEDIEAGTRRILVEQCERAEEQLASATDTASAVHEARKSLKRMRALLRFVREAIGDERWRADNTALRDVGLSLSPLRDSDVAKQTIKLLATDAPPPVAKALQSLALHLEQMGGDAVNLEARQQIMAAAHVRLAVFRQQCLSLPVPGDMQHVMTSGLQRGHARTRSRLLRLGETPGNEALLELRTAVQAHWRHMVLMTQAWPAIMKARAAEARTLSTLLGEDQDLAMIEGKLVEAGGHGLSRAAATKIASACRERRDSIQSEAVARANRLFLEKPGRFAAQVTRAWILTTQIKGEAAGPQVSENT